MFDLTTLPVDTPLPFVAIAVVANLVRRAIDRYHERKKQEANTEMHDRIVILSAKLAASEAKCEALEARLKE